MIINDEIITIRDLIVANSDCEQVYLFGSYAYGSPREDSDYDFYVVLNDKSKLPMLVMEDLCVCYGHMRLSLIRQNKNLGRKVKLIPVDFLAQYRSRFEERSKYYPFEHAIAEKGVLLYDKHALNKAMVSRSGN
jgi:predicted nucleotidyltransferase